MPRGWWGAVPGGVACHRCEGRLVSGAVPPPAARPLERAARVPRPVCPGCGRCRRGDPAPAPGRGDGVQLPHPHTRAHSTWVADPNSPPSGRAVGGGTAPGLRRPSQWWKAPPPGTPFRHPHGEQRRPATACPVGVACRGGGGGPSPGGVACHRYEGRLVSGTVPPPAARPLERAARVPRPVCPGCDRCGRGDPAPAPQRAPLRDGVAR